MIMDDNTKDNTEEAQDETADKNPGNPQLSCCGTPGVHSSQSNE